MDVFGMLLNPRYVVVCVNTECPRHGERRKATLPYVGDDLIILPEIYCRGCAQPVELVAPTEEDGL